MRKRLLVYNGMLPCLLASKDTRLTGSRTSSWASVEKPLPSVPKITRVQTCLAYVKALFRSLGLNLLVYVLQHLLGFGLDEIPKKAFQRDRLMALLRATIHILPFTVAMGEVIINWRGYYIGANVNGLNLLQFAAKLHASKRSHSKMDLTLNDDDDRKWPCSLLWPSLSSVMCAT